MFGQADPETSGKTQSAPVISSAMTKNERAIALLRALVDALESGDDVVAPTVPPPPLPRRKQVRGPRIPVVVVTDEMRARVRAAGGILGE